MLYGAAKRSHEKRTAREANQRKRAGVRRDAFEKMQESHRTVKRLGTARFNQAVFQSHVQIAKSVFWISVYAVPTLAMVAGLIRFIFWIL